MDLETPEVLDLLRRVAQKDEPAFRRLYNSVSRRVYAFAMHHLHDATAAAEVVGEALYEVWRRPEAFRGDAKFSTWVLGIARHKMLDRMRSKAPEHEDIDEHLELADTQALEGFEHLAQRQRSAGVATCLDKLGEPHRECLYLVYFEGLSVAEVGAVQGVPEGTVKTRLFHARANIKRCLQRLLAREGGGDDGS